jgi:hypothetical protein
MTFVCCLPNLCSIDRAGTTFLKRGGAATTPYKHSIEKGTLFRYDSQRAGNISIGVDGASPSSHEHEQFVPDELLDSLDAILVLGGGVPISASLPPIYVQTRCGVAAKLVMESTERRGQSGTTGGPVIITLSAGTAHLPQLLNAETGLPIWESTASAAYILNNYPKVPPSKLFAETTSYDTISNAFYTRTSFTDIMGWRKLLVITNEVRKKVARVSFLRHVFSLQFLSVCVCQKPRTREIAPPFLTKSISTSHFCSWNNHILYVHIIKFHMDRTRAIFDWIFSAPNELQPDNNHIAGQQQQPQPYEVHYLSCDNTGLSEQALVARRQHEAKGASNIRSKLSTQYRTMQDVFRFLTSQHDFYNATKLAKTAQGLSGKSVAENDAASALKDSYGGGVQST